MIALGVTWAGQGAPPPLVRSRSGVFGLVTADRAPSARCRFALQTRAAEAFSAFLPFSPTRAVGVEDAASWCARNADAVEGALHAADGACRMVLDLTPVPGEHCDRPRDWLRQRARRLSLARGIRAALAPVARAVVVHVPGAGVRLDILVDRSDVPSIATLARTTADGLPLAGWSLLLTGPWPVAGFRGLDLP